MKSGRINSGGSQLFPPLSFARFLKCYFQGSTSTYFYIGKDSPSLVLSLEFRIRIKPIPYYLSIFVNYLKKHIKFNQKEESTNYSICLFLFHTTVLYITHIPTFTGPDLEIYNFYFSVLLRFAVSGSRTIIPDPYPGISS